MSDLPILSCEVMDLTDIEILHPDMSKAMVVRINGEEFTTTRRFWDSFASRFKINENIFQYFNPEETFRRVAEVYNGMVKVCLDRTGRRINAITGVDSRVVTVNDIQHLAARYPGCVLQYKDGTVIVKRKMGNPFEIGGDEFDKLFYVDIPVDGYGLPKIYASLERLICENGLIGFSNFLKTDVNIGKEPLLMLDRAFSSYNNDGGFSWLMERIVAAQHTPASVGEVYRAMHQEKLMMHPVLDAVRNGACKKYGISSLSAISEKKQRLLSTVLQMYELINLLTEYSTHRVSHHDQRRVNAFIMTLLTKEFDLENTDKPRDSYVDRYWG